MTDFLRRHLAGVADGLGTVGILIDLNAIHKTKRMSHHDTNVAMSETLGAILNSFSSLFSTDGSLNPT